MKKRHIYIAFCVLIASFPISAQTIESNLRETTSIENIYSSMLPEGMAGRVNQIGYELLGSWNPTVSTEVDEGYLVGPGDSLRVYIWGDPVDYGAVLSTYDVEVDPDGSIFLKPIGRVSVFGRTLSEIDGILHVKFSIKYKNINIETTPLKLREFSVYVTGFVKKPGAVNVSNLWSAIDLLAYSGGVLFEGSLRDIRIIRNGKTLPVDLYDLFINGAAAPVNAKVVEGDILYVPPIGRTAAAVGDVKRPGIYELLEDETVSDLINFAGGAGLAGSLPAIKLLRRSGAFSTVLEGEVEDENFINDEIMDGDIMILQSGMSVVDNMIQVRGPVKNPGLYTVTAVPTLVDILLQVGILPGTDTDTGIITRIETDKPEERIIFSPREVLLNNSIIPLKPNDVIDFFKRGELYAEAPLLLTVNGKESINIPYIKGITLLDVLNQAENLQKPEEMEARIIRGDEIVDQVILRNILILGKISQNIEMKAGDKIALVPLMESNIIQGIQVLGQVSIPGMYQFSDGLTLFDILSAAGGYTEKAYPKGITLYRDSVKNQQLDQVRITIQRTREELLQVEGALAAQNLTEDAETSLKIQLETQKALLDIAEKQLGEYLGKIILTIPEKLADLKGNSGNILLQEGDTLFIPEKSGTVSVFGDIDTAAAMPWVAGKTVKQYLFDLGGLRSKDYKISIVKYNGKIVTEENLFFGWSSIENQVLEQGDTIIAVKRISLPAGAAFIDSFTNITDTIYKIVYSLDTVGLL
ncbi:MAG: SLBB domain-containing protein [Spirochaetia bacterium]|nr:SLBB domain-containing protein [Spirochaetia bacterium]